MPPDDWVSVYGLEVRVRVTVVRITVMAIRVGVTVQCLWLFMRHVRCIQPMNSFFSSAEQRRCLFKLKVIGITSYVVVEHMPPQCPTVSFFQQVPYFGLYACKV